MKEVYVVNQCDAWRSYDSFRLVGIFTTRKKLNVILNRLLKNKSIQWYDEERSDRFVTFLTDRELQNNLKYIHIEVIKLNEIQ
jgi:hypothetical protein